MDGYVVNALTGDGIAYADVELRYGADAPEGQLIARTNANQNGAFKARLWP